jgi:hypothetical protein
LVRTPVFKPFHDNIYHVVNLSGTERPAGINAMPFLQATAAAYSRGMLYSFSFKPSLNFERNFDLLQRAIQPSSGQVAYYAAGPAGVGTTGAAIYLIRNWRELQKKYGDDRPFLVLLRFRSPDPAQYEVVVEKGQ